MLAEVPLRRLDSGDRVEHVRQVVTETGQRLLATVPGAAIMSAIPSIYQVRKAMDNLFEQYAGSAFAQMGLTLGEACERHGGPLDRAARSQS